MKKITSYSLSPEARGGLSIKEVLETLLNESSFACLILTGEDIDKDDLLHARENVIHDAGLFQGRLGFSKLFVLVSKSFQISVV